MQGRYFYHVIKVPTLIITLIYWCSSFNRNWFQTLDVVPIYLKLILYSFLFSQTLKMCSHLYIRYLNPKLQHNRSLPVILLPALNVYVWHFVVGMSWTGCYE